MRTRAGSKIFSGTRSSCALRQGGSGYSLVMIAMLSIVMVALLGLAFDCGRMFILKSEIQAFCDSAALASVRYLDGTKTGIDQAHTTALNGPLGTKVPNGVNFDTVKVTTATETYAQTLNGTYDSYATATGAATNSYRFVRVTATVTTPLYFMGVLQGLSSSVQVGGSAIAGQQQQDALFNNGGLLPFSPAAHDAGDTKNFGLVPGQRYTLKWGKKSAETDCPGDLGWTKANSFPAQRGYVDLGQGTGASGLKQAIEFGGFPNGIDPPKTIDAGDNVDGTPGNKAPSLTAIVNRSNQDTDQTSATWNQYKVSLGAGTANGRRLVLTLIDDPDQATTGGNGTYRVIGFGAFLLDPSSVYDSQDQGGKGSYCATYIGPASLTGGTSGGSSGTSVYKVMLFR